MVAVKVVGGQLGRHAAPGEAHARTEHRHDPGRPADHAQQIGNHARNAETYEHQREQDPVRVGVAARRSAERRSEHSQDDGCHRDVLTPSGVLAEHPLRHHQQHEQSGGQRRLHNGERGEQEGDHLQRPAEDGHARAQQPSLAPEQTPSEREAQMIAGGRLLGVHRLECDT